MTSGRLIRVFDTTLRDGEQTPGVSLTPQEKLEIAQALDRLGVDVIEAGFPITSKGEQEAIRAIGEVGSESGGVRPGPRREGGHRHRHRVRDKRDPRLPLLLGHPPQAPDEHHQGAHDLSSPLRP